MKADGRRVRTLGAGILSLACVALMLAAALAAVDIRPVHRYASTGRGTAVEPVKVPSGSVDINHGSLSEVMRLPGIGEVIGRAIIDERMLYGPYHYPEDLLAVRGIGEKKLEGMRNMLLICNDRHGPLSE